MFNAYGASLDWIARDRALLRDTVAAMIEANRTIYRDKDKVVPIIVKATEQAEGRGRIRHRRADQELRLVGQRRLRSQAHRNGRSRTASRTATSRRTRSRRSSRSPISRSPRRRSKPPAARSPSATARIDAHSRKTPAPDLIRGGSMLSRMTTRKIEETAMNIQTPRPPDSRPGTRCARKPRPERAVRQHVRHALLPRRGLRAVLQGRNTPAATPRCAPRCASTSSTA